MTPIGEGPSRKPTVSAGRNLAGTLRHELFEAAQRHLAHRHPQLLGALGLDVVQQMGEERPGALNA